MRSEWNDPIERRSFPEGFAIIAAKKRVNTWLVLGGAQNWNGGSSQYGTCNGAALTLAHRYFLANCRSWRFRAAVGRWRYFNGREWSRSPPAGFLTPWLKACSSEGTQ